jgi:hypothetical protein
MKRIIVALIVVLLVVAGWTGAWFWGASQITSYAKSLETADGVTTPRVVCADFGVGGFPLGFDVTCTNATVTTGDTVATIAGLKGSMDVYDPLHVLISAKSPATLADSFTGSSSKIDFDSLVASGRLNGWRLARISVVLDKPVWNDVVIEDQPRLIAKADQAEAHLVDLPAKYDGSKHLQALGQYAEIDNLNAPGFAINAGKTTLEGEVSNLPDDVRLYDATLLKRWQQAGGQFTLVSLKGDDGDNRFAATGNLNLDDQGRVGGQLKLNSKGVIERFQDAIPQQLRGVVVGAQAADGSYSQTFNIAAGVVFAGLLPATVIPPVF